MQGAAELAVESQARALVCLPAPLVMDTQSAADGECYCMQAFKEARDAMADAAAKRPPSATAGDNQEVARVLRYCIWKTFPCMRLLLSLAAALALHQSSSRFAGGIQSACTGV